MGKKILKDFLEMKKNGEKISMLSVADASTARIAERAGIDILALGDSLGMVLMGYETTLKVTVEDMILFGKAVRRGAPNTYFFVAMPYGSYRNVDIAVENAIRFIQEVGADAVKVQGGRRSQKQIEAITRTGIPCWAHVGLQPHLIPMLGGFKVQGRTAEEAKMIYDDALIAQEAGAVGIEVEAIPPQIAKKITENVDIITYSIGAGPHCDAQLLISWDMLGLFDLFKPKFVKRYSKLAEVAQNALEDYKREVCDGTFPAEEHTYSMSADELSKFEEMF